MSDFNDRVALLISNATGNMWFFWAALAFVLALRISHPPAAADLLLNVENDLQLLLLAVSAVIGGKQLANQSAILKTIQGTNAQIEHDVQVIEKEIESD